MKSQILLAQLKNIFNQGKNSHFSWLIQGEFGVDFDHFLTKLCDELFELENFAQSANVLYITNEGEIKIDEIRKINHFLSNKSEEWRVVIIQNADHMNKNAANAILKILEEPPEKTLFLCTTMLDLPLTILSRMDVFYLSLENDFNSDDKIMKIADGSHVIAEKIVECGGLEFIQLMQDIILEENNYSAIARILEMIDLSKHFETICYLILYFLREKFSNVIDFIEQKKKIYQYEKIIQRMGDMQKLNCNKKAFLFSLLN